jgi:transcription initiation factor TFIIIB Brf1 subunit/transcription initiation factor TFIIB
MYLYKKLLRKNFKKEGSISTLAMAAFCLLHANRLNGNRLLTSKEVIDAFRRMGHRLAPFDLIKAGLLYRKLLNEKPKILRSEDALVMILERIFSNEEVNFILKSCGEKHFELKRKLFRSGMKLLREVKSVQRGGRSPILLATTALYAAERKLAIEENRRPMLTQRLLAKAMHVSEYSVREHFRLFFRPLLRS